MEMTKIYGLADPRSGHLRYVGKTARTLSARLRGHIEVRHKSFHNARWIQSLWDRGLRPDIFLIDEVQGSGSDEERFYIAYFKSIGCALTNATEGGEGWTPSPEVREKLRAAATGRTHSDATKQKLRDGNLGKKMSPDAIARTRAALLGRRFSEETLGKMRAAALHRSPEWRAKVSAAAKGHKRWLGRSHTPETKAKISAAARSRRFFSLLVRSAAFSVTT